jgi:hypothetical protein
MREVTIEGKTFSVRPLKRSEMKSLKKQGFILGKMEPESMDDWLDKIMEMALPGRLDEIDDLPPKAANMIFEAVLKESYGDKNEEKNS